MKLKAKKIPGSLGLILSLLLAVPGIGKSQSTGSCPPNIGFETGGFDHWEAFTGSVLGDGNLILIPTGPVYNSQTIFEVSNTPEIDPYGFFPVTCPNGSRFSIRLGNDQVGAQAERLSYTFTIPADQNNYSIIYNYAAVIQNPDHQHYQQPKFTSQVFDVSANEYISCASFEFIASGNLPGFQLSSQGDNVYYKPWSPVTINLSGYAGKTIRLEFTNNDCTLGGHFGYAYLDINENCTSPIGGNVYCAGMDNVTLSAPFGFNEYAWYDANFSQLLGTSSTLNITPAPPDNTVYALVLSPYIGLGCQDTLYTTIDASPEVLTLVVKDSLHGCSTPGLNLTVDSVTAGSTAGLHYSYFLDPLGENHVTIPTAVTSSGLYYIQGSNNVGCRDVKPVVVLANGPPSVVISPPPLVCFPSTVDITQPSIVTGSQAGLTYSFWNDEHALFALTTPNAIAGSGIYYIKGTSPIGCFAVIPVNVNIADIKINDANECGVADLTSESITLGSNGDFEYSYWRDALASEAIPTPNSISASGTYYLKGITSTGCSIIKPVQVNIRALPDLIVAPPATVHYPERIDLTALFTPTGNSVYSFWSDAAASVPLTNPEAIARTGIYYIKAVNQFNCSIVIPVNITVIPPPPGALKVPNAFSPNGDGIYDQLKLSTIGEVGGGKFRVFNRFGQLVFETADLSANWDGKLRGNPLPVATYYWTFDGADTYHQQRIRSSGSITLIR